MGVYLFLLISEKFAGINSSTESTITVTNPFFFFFNHIMNTMSLTDLKLVFYEQRQ